MSAKGGCLNPIGPLFSKRFLKFAWVVIILTLIVFFILYKQGKLPENNNSIETTEEIQ